MHLADIIADMGRSHFTCLSVAGERSGAPTAVSPGVLPAASSQVKDTGVPSQANIVNGYDIDVLVDAALGKCDMPTAPMYLDAFGMPLTRLAPTHLVAVPPMSPATQLIAQAQPQTPSQPSALEIANAALAAAYGTPTIAQQPLVSQMTSGQLPTRVLVLSNMVTSEDLASDDEYNGLQEEVREECAKYGQLRGMQIPRSAGGAVQQSAILKIFLEYASANEAQVAERELKGRKFGENVVLTHFFSESDYAAGRLY